MTFSLISTGISGFIMRPSLVYHDLFVTCTLGCYNRIYVLGRVCANYSYPGTSEEQGRLYGYWFLGKGLTSIVLGFLSVPVFAKFGEGVDGLRATIIFYSVVTILAGVLARFVCQDETHCEDKANFRLADMAFVLKMPTVWLAGVVTFVCGQFISALAWSRRI